MRCSRRISAARAGTTTPRSPITPAGASCRRSRGRIALALAAVDEAQRDAFGRASAGYVGGERRMAGFRAQRRHDLGVRLGGSRQRRVARASCRGLACSRSGSARARESAATLALTACSSRSSTRASVTSLGWRSGTRDRGFRPSTSRVSRPIARAVPDLRDGAARSSGQDLSGSDGRELERAVGKHQGGARGISPGVAARSGRMRRRACSRSARRARRATPSDTCAPPSSPTGTGTRTSISAAKPYWTGVQLDETALPVLLAALLADRGALEGTESRRHGEARALLHRPPRAAERSGSLGGKRGPQHVHPRGMHLRAGQRRGVPRRPTRASWRSISRITGIRGSRTGPPCTTRRSRARTEFPGYYVRVAPSQAIGDRGALDRVLAIKNQAMDPGLPAAAQFGVDFLQLVRFGLRRHDDPLIVGQRAARRCVAQGRHAERPVLASLFRRRLRRARRRQRVRRGRPRPRVAAAHRRARALRNRLRQRSRRRSWKRWRAWPRRGGCCRSRSGMRRPSCSAGCIPARRPDRPCRSPGPMRSS